MSNRPLFIFEMANNHMGDLSHGLRIVRELREATNGFDFRFAIKLQYRDLATLIHPAYRARTDLKFIKRFTETAMSWDDYRRLKDGIVGAGFLSACTPFDEVSVDKVVEHGFDLLKVASCSVTDWPLAEKIATTKLPLIISTAGATLEEIDRVVSFYQHRDKRLTVMHCVGEYPTAPANLQLNQIDILKKRYTNIQVGFSTHEAPEELDAIGMAIAKGSTVFEKHVGVATPAYPLNAYSASPAQVRAWIEAAGRAFAMNGVEGRRHEFAPNESASLNDLKRGVYAKRPIGVDEVLSDANVVLCMPTMPGQLTASDLSKYTEYRARRAIVAGDPAKSADALRTDTRSLVHGIVREVKKLLKESRAVVPAQLELEISHHYGLERFSEVGAAMITVINREYCKRLLLLLPGQRHPEHWHTVKDETFHILYGEINIAIDGLQKKCSTNDVVVLARGVKHEFSSTTGAVIEEVSSTHSKGDSVYADEKIMRNKYRKTFVTNWMD
jgi:sialic acid synthase SpsE/quercetin dioxygenase-like cupin family protein